MVNLFNKTIRPQPLQLLVPKNHESAMSGWLGSKVTSQPIADHSFMHTTAFTLIKHKWHMPQVGSTSQNTCNTIASITVNSLLLKRPYSGTVQDSTECTKSNVYCDSAMIEIHYHVRISDRHFLVFHTW